MDRNFSVYDRFEDNHKYYDFHTLYIPYCEVDREDLVKIINKYLGKMKVKCQYKMNFIDRKDGRKFAYIWLNNPEAYHIMTGKERDGSERYELIDDPNFEAPDIPLEQALEEMDPDDWALDEDDIKDMYKPKKIKKDLGLLVEQDTYNENGDIIMIVPAYVSMKEFPFINNVLYAGKIPDWLTRDVLLRYLKPFATDPDEKMKTKAGTRSYPLILFKENKKGRYVIITFSEKSMDANFCLLMNRRMKIAYKGQSTTFYLDHFRKGTPRQDQS